MRTIHQLLILLHAVYAKDIDPNRKDESTNYPGLCSLIHNMPINAKITNQERLSLHSYLANNYPKRLNKPTISSYLYKTGYYWLMWKRKPRLQWLTTHINKTKLS